jgi:membrane protease YdiL (CAAX protease family)
MSDTLAKKPVAGLKTVAMTFFLSVGLAFGINALFGSRSLASAFGDGAPLANQLILGATIGLVFSVPVVSAALRMPIFSRLREHCIERSRMLDLRGLNPVWMSLVAGIGEEILFRGAIQPLLGLWLTSAIFSLLHIQPSQYRSISAGTIWYAGFVFLVSLLLGSIYTTLGLVAAMVFHTTGDLVGLFTLRHVSQAAVAAREPLEPGSQATGSG